MIYLVSDIHGHLRLDYLKDLLTTVSIKSTDYLIILGDVGIYWKPTNKKVEKFYSNLKCTVLFIDGNHENFDELYKKEEIEMFSSKVRKINNNIFHLERGRKYIIDGYSFFCFGGGYSPKREESGIPIWPQELPSKEEYERGLKTLEENNYEFDYIFTHIAPYNLMMQMLKDKKIKKINHSEFTLHKFLMNIAKKAKFKRWYLGHYHVDYNFKNFTVVYNNIYKLGDK